MMKFLDYIQGISSSEEEFLAIIEEMNRWVAKHPLGREDDEEQRFIHVPHNNRRLNFSREEYKQALKLSSQAIQSAESHQYHKQKLPKDGENQNTSDTLLFWK